MLMWLSRFLARGEDAIYVRKHWIFNRRSSGVVAMGRRYY